MSSHHLLFQLPRLGLEIPLVTGKAGVELENIRDHRHVDDL